MKRLIWRAGVTIAAVLLIGGCGQTAESESSSAAQLQTFVGDFLRQVLAAYLI